MNSKLLARLQSLPDGTHEVNLGDCCWKSAQNVTIIIPVSGAYITWATTCHSCTNTNG